MNPDQGANQRFADFMAAMATRYPTIPFWELWNEMDVGFTDLFGAGVTGGDSRPIPMAERGRMYAEMLKLAYPAIEDPGSPGPLTTGPVL